MSEAVELRTFIEQQIKSLNEKLDAVVEAHRQVHLQLAQQVTRDANTVDKRLEGMNELRQQINYERGMYVTRETLDPQVRAIHQRIEEIIQLTNLHYAENGKRIAALEQSKANMDGRIAMLGLLLVIIQIAVTFLVRFLK